MAVLVEGADEDPQRGWPDAVSAGWWAAARGAPILLTPTEELPDATRDALEDLRPETVTVVGGTAAVSEDVRDEVRALGTAVERVAGADRYETSDRVARRARSGTRTFPLWVATGTGYADALAAGPAVARSGGQLLLVDGSAPGSPSVGNPALVLRENKAPETRVHLVGGPAAIAPAIGVELERAARTLPGERSEPPPSDCPRG